MIQKQMTLIDYLRALDERYPGAAIPAEIMSAGELANLLEELQTLREHCNVLSDLADNAKFRHYSEL